MDKIVLFVGAGYSKWACGLPLVSELFDFDIYVRNTKEEKRLARIKKLKDSWDERNFQVNPEVFIESLRGKPAYKILVWYISRRLSDAFLARSLNGVQTLQIDQKAKWENKGILRSKEFLDGLLIKGLETVLTTNYDLLIEYSLGTNGFYYDQNIRALHGRGKNPSFPWHNPNPELTGPIKILKLHGSLSWTAEGTRFTDSRCGLTGKGMIVAPIRNKQGVGFLQNIWDESKTELREADKIIFFGFAFNPIDENILSILRSQIRSTSEIFIVNKYFNEKYIETIFPGNKIAFLYPPSPSEDMDEYLSTLTTGKRAT